MGGDTPTKTARWPVALVVALALLVHAPALGWGFFADDHGLMLMLEQPIEHPTLRSWSLFDFGYAPAAGHEDASWSFLPWWTSPDWKVRFFRPLASVTHLLDFELFGRNAAMHHATSLVLFGALLVALHGLYRTAGLSPKVALCALAVFGFEDGSVMPVGWIANRSTVLEALFAVASVLTLLRGAARPSSGRIAAAFALALLSCLSKESGVVTFAALAIALATFASRAPPQERTRLIGAGALSALAGLGYVAFLLLAGYGTHSLFYVMPWLQPFVFGQRALWMLVLGAQGALGPFSIDVAMMFPRFLVPWIAIALAVGVPVILWIGWRERALPWGFLFAAWSLLALIPQAGTYPSDRLMFVPMIGLAPWIGSFVSHAFERVPWRARWLAVLTVITAIPLSAGVTLLRAAGFTAISEHLRGAILSAEVPRDGSRCDALVLQSPTILSMLSPDTQWYFLTGLRAVRFHPLQVGRDALRITTVDQRTFDVTDLERAMLSTPFDAVFLSTAEPPPVGRVLRARGFSVESRAVDELGLRTVRIVLDEPIASPRWRFLAWRDGAFRSTALPPIGESVELARCDPLDPMMP